MANIINEIFVSIGGDRRRFDALVAALGEGLSVVPERKAFRVPWTILEASWIRSESISVPSPGTSARLAFRTPVRLGPRRAMAAQWPDLIVALADRAVRLGRWQALHIEPSLGEWRRLAERTAFRELGMFPVVWDRRSGVQGGKRIPMMGLIGKLDIVAPPEALMPLLALGETMHAGGHTSLGLGRYALFCY